MEESYGSSFAIARLNLLPVVVRLHGPWFLNGNYNDPSELLTQRSHREKWERRGILTAQLVTAPSAEVLQAVKDHYRLTLPASRVIPNPLEAKVETETHNAEDCGNDTLLFVGRFDRRKGGDLVLRTFGELAASYPSLRLTFVGPDIGIVQRDGTILKFEHFVHQTLPDWCRSRIQFYGQLNHSDVMALRPKHFLTIIASQYEPFGYCVLEAMSVGCPAIATAVGGIPELIQDGRNGVLVPPHDINAMIAGCKNLLDDPSLAARLGRQAWRDCRELYGPSKIAEQTVAAYEEAVYRFKAA
jgi:glycosyltransferase involved in cell wall biosynthesis